jgi:hypothetical protein
MRQVLHLLIVDRARRAALAATHGSRWLLPVMTCDEKARAAPLVARWCAQRDVASDVAGQWLGRVGQTTTDWLMAIPARTACPAVDATLEWIPLDTLASSASVLDYETWALARSLGRGALPSVDGPFGNLEWPEAVRTWIAESAGSPHAWTPYRASAHEVVLGVETACGRVYLKGLENDRAGEARLTESLAALAPDSFARTLALESRRDESVLWLTAECAGRPGRDARLVAPALARIQHMTAMARGSLALRTLDVEMAARWATELVADSARGAAIRHACARVMDANVPRTWIPMDLDPANVLVDDDEVVRFIDVDDSFLGPAPLAMATLALRCDGQALYCTYERAWSPPLTGVDWSSFEVAARVVESWLGWQRLERGIERGEVHAALDAVSARVRDRLGRAIDRR